MEGTQEREDTVGSQDQYLIIFCTPYNAIHQAPSNRPLQVHLKGGVMLTLTVAQVSPPVVSLHPLCVASGLLPCYSLWPPLCQSQFPFLPFSKAL